MHISNTEQFMHDFITSTPNYVLVASGGRLLFMNYSCAVLRSVADVWGRRGGN